MTNSEPNLFLVQLDPGGVWRVTIFTGLMIAVTIIITKFFTRLALPAKLLLGYTLIWPLYIISFPNYSYGGYHTAFQASAGQTFAELLIISLAAWVYPWKKGALLEMVTLFQIISVWFLPYGLMETHSFDLAFIALCVPFVSFWSALAAVVTILAHHGATADMILGAIFISALLKNKAEKIFVVILILILAGAAYYHTHGTWFDGGDRIAHYKHYLALWATNKWTLIFGVGAGTFTWASFTLDQFKSPMWIQLHSDWLQILFELGLVGLGLAVWTFYSALTTAWKQPKSGLLEKVAAAGCFALTYHPLRFFPSAYLIASIFSEALKADQKGGYDGEK